MSRKNAKIKYLFGIVFTLFFVFTMKIESFAADLNVTVTSTEVTQGDTVTVVVKMSSSANIGAYDLAVTFDENVLEYVSGADAGGGSNLLLYNDFVNATSDSKTLTFKAKKAGSSAISVLQRGDVCDINGDNLTLKSVAGTVNVKAPQSASSNNNLASLQIEAVRENGTSGSWQLQPAFSPDVTKYDIFLLAEFVKLTVAAKPADATSTVAVSGTDLVAGTNNTVTITVTAKDGSTKKYTIIAHVNPKENTTEESSTEDNTVPVIEGGDKIFMDGKGFIIVNVDEGTSLPEGFETADVEYNGTAYKGARNLSGNLSLLYAADSESGKTSFFVYESESGDISPFVAYGITQRRYIILSMEDLNYGGVDAQFSSKLELTTLNIDGNYVEAYMLAGTEGVYIVRVCNWDNKIGYYYYNTVDGSMTPMFELSDNEAAVSVPSGNKNSTKTESDNKLLLVILAVACAVLLISNIVLIVKNRRYEDYDDEYDDEYEDEYEDEYDGESEENGDIEPDMEEQEENNAVEDDSEAVTEVKSIEDDSEAVVEASEEISEQVVDAETEIENNSSAKSEEDVDKESEENEDIAENEELSEEIVPDIDLAIVAEEMTEETEKEQMKAEPVNTSNDKEEVSDSKEEALDDKEEASKEQDENTQKEMTAQEFDSAIDDILGKLFK